MHARIAGALRRTAPLCLAFAATVAAAHATLPRAPGADIAAGDDDPAPTDARPPEQPAPGATTASARAGAPPEAAPPRWRTLAASATIETTRGATRVVPPREGAEPANVVTFLHGACMSPSETCSRLDPLTADGSFLVCPTGNAACGGGAADWAGPIEEKSAALDAGVGEALDALELPARADGRDDVLVGFSRGAFVARDVAYASSGRYRGLVLIGAAMIPDAALLRERGIRRVVLASGDWDGARKTMVKALVELCDAGLPTRFVGLGPVWHALPKDSPHRLRDAMGWVRADGDPGPLACKRPPAVRPPSGA